jgi:hypothetical protein
MVEQLTVVGEQAFDDGTFDWMAVTAVNGRVQATFFALPDDVGEVDVPAGVAGLSADEARRVADIFAQAADTAEATS